MEIQELKKILEQAEELNQEVKDCKKQLSEMEEAL